jgi:hydrogenase maturation protease
MAGTVVLGVGNILLSDEGFGVRVAELLQARCRFPDDVKVLDGGTLGMELMRFLEGTQRLILIDAVHGPSEPGSFHEIRGDLVHLYFQEKVSLHELGIQEVLASLTIMDKPIKEIVVFGVVPVSLEIGLALTPPVSARLEEAAERVIQQLESWNISTTEPSE